MFFRRSKQEREALQQPFPDAWRQRLAYRWPMFTTLSPDERERLEDLVKRFLARVRFEAAQGFTVTDEMRVLVAAQACLPVLELDLDLYRQVTSVILHPRTVVLKGTRNVGSHLASDTDQTLAGQAHHRGPVVLSWSTVAYEARHHERGQNVVIHEFAHQLDMLDGMIDGTPPITDRDLRARWVTACTAEYRKLRRGEEGILRPYAATDTGEFFAVAVETFFTVPVAFAEGAPELYALLCEVFGQDPAARLNPAP
ncbi:MAG: zinc-dependent peptidase [Actinobacteria bacterium]|nr:zinc-dependent peptidase [Actinomycetota bacterium]